MARAPSVHVIGEGAARAALLARLGAAGIRFEERPEPTDAWLLLVGEGRPVATELAPLAQSAHAPVIVVGLARDAELTRALCHGGAEEVLFADELDRLPELLRELQEHGPRNARSEPTDDETMRALILALDTREQETAGHSHRVALWTLFFSLAAGVPESLLRPIHRGALLHDLGKIGISDSILMKSGELTPSEWSEMRTHPRLGRDLVWRIARLRSAAEIPWAHHERWDGAGYPRGLKGEEIPLGARLFALVDVYDALRCARPYKRAFQHSESLAFLREGSGKHFDPELCARFVAIPESAWHELAAPDLDQLSYPQLLERAHAVLARLVPAAPAR